MKRILIIALTAVALLAIVFYVHRRNVRQPVAILSTATIQAQLIPSLVGDMHAGGMILLASALKRLRNDMYKDRSLLLDAGNSMFQDDGHRKFSQKMPELLRKMQFDAITLGFRDFRIADDLDWNVLPPVLGCNVEVRERSKDATDQPSKFKRIIPSKLFVVHGMRIAVIGAVDPGTLEHHDDIVVSFSRQQVQGSSVPRDEDVTVLNVRRTVERIEAEANYWHKQKVDAIVLLSSALDPGVNAYFAKNISHLNLIVGRNESDHGSIIETKGRAIVAAASGGKTIAVVHATRSHQGLSIEARSEIDVNSQEYSPDVEFLHYAQDYWIDYIRQSDNHVIGVVEDPKIPCSKDGKDPPVKNGIPLQLEHPLVLGYPYWSYFESPMIRLVAQAMREEYPQWARSHSRSSRQVDIAFVNSGTLEHGLRCGIVTLTMLRNALPYNNDVVEVVLTRQQIVEMLNSEGMKEHGILGVSGLQYIWDYNTGKVDEASLRYAPLKGKPVPLANRQYVVVVSKFVLNEGDGYMKGKSFEPVRRKSEAVDQQSEDSCGRCMVELLKNYIYRNSPISATITPKARFLR